MTLIDKLILQEPKSVDITDAAYEQGADQLAILVVEAMKDAHSKSVAVRAHHSICGLPGRLCSIPISETVCQSTLACLCILSLLVDLCPGYEVENVGSGCQLGFAKALSCKYISSAIAKSTGSNYCLRHLAWDS
jgi:hypothetical protein